MVVVMLKKLFVAVAIVIASQDFVSAQDIFWSFSPTALIDSTSISDLGGVGDSGSVYIFADGLFGFDALDLNFRTSRVSVIRFTGAEVFNPTFSTIGGERFYEPTISIDSVDVAGQVGKSGKLFAVNLAQNGVDPALSSFDPGFEPGVGPNGAVLLARVDFEVGGVAAPVDLEFTLGPHGALQLPSNVLNPSFGSATLLPHLGDVNGDSAVDFFDFTPFVMVLFINYYEYAADCNQDGVVNFFDIEPFIAIVNSQ